MKHAANVHLLEPVELALPPDRYRDAFPSACGGFVLDGGDFALLGAEPFLSFRAYRSGPRSGLASGRLSIRSIACFLSAFTLSGTLSPAGSIA